MDHDLVVHAAGESLPHDYLPGRSEGLVEADLDVGGDLGWAPGGVLQGGGHDVTGLRPLLLLNSEGGYRVRRNRRYLDQGAPDDDGEVVKILVAEMFTWMIYVSLSSDL